MFYIFKILIISFSDLDDFKFKYREKLDYIKEELIQDCMDGLEQIENKIDKEFQLNKEEA